MVNEPYKIGIEKFISEVKEGKGDKKKIAYDWIVNKSQYITKEELKEITRLLLHEAINSKDFQMENVIADYEVENEY